MLRHFIGNKTVIVLAWCVSNTHYIVNRTLKERVYIIYVTYMNKLYNCINWFMLFYNSTIYNCINWFILFHNSTIFVRVLAPPEIILRVQLHPLHPLFRHLCGAIKELCTFCLTSVFIVRSQCFRTPIIQFIFCLTLLEWATHDKSLQNSTPYSGR